MVGKKKAVSGQKETSQTETGEEGKENREKGGEKEAVRRRGGAPRKGRGASRGRECKYRMDIGSDCLILIQLSKSLCISSSVL